MLALAGAGTLAAAVVAVLLSSATHANATAQEQPPNTATVERGNLSDQVSQYGTLTYRAQSNGVPYTVINRARGTYTRLPDEGDKVDCGDVLYRVDDRPVLMLCGSTPAYRSLSKGDRGRDVRELNANLVHLGYASRGQLDPRSDTFSSETAAALQKLQRRLGENRSGSLQLGRAVFLPRPVRVAAVNAELGGGAQPGGRVAQATSGILEVRVNLDPSQQDEVKRGDRAQITLPGNEVATGHVERLGRIAQIPAGSSAGGATIPAYVRLDDPDQARGLDEAPVQVEITTKGVANALSVPATAIVGRPGGGFAVEVERPNARRALVAVKLGLFDGAGGRVQVEGDLREGDRVVVGSS